MKKIVLLLSVLLAVCAGCTKDDATKDPANIQPETLTAFNAKMKMNNTTKTWKSASSSSTNSTAVPAAGVDYFANHGGINPNEMTLISFGKFTDDKSTNLGRLTIFLNDVSDLGTYKIGGSSASNGVISVFNNERLEHYSTNQNNEGAVIITKYDLVNNVVSGSFSFTATNENNKLEITDGSFTDVPFKQ